MAAVACPSCGNVNPLGTERCVKCGTTLPVATRTVTCPNCKNLNPIGTMQCVKCGATLPVDYLKPQVVDPAAEKKGLGSIKIAALALLITGVMIYVFPIVTWAYYGYQLPSTIPCCPIDSGSIVVPPVPHSLEMTVQIIAGIGVAFAGVAWIFFGLAFRSFTKVDRSYGVASISAFIGIVSVLLVGAAIALNIENVANYLNCLSNTPNLASTTCLTNLNNVSYTVYWLWAFSIMFLIFGGIGVLIGLFRLGARYLASSFWLAGFLLIFPILLLIGAILLLVAAMGGEKRLASWKKGVDAEAASGTPATT